MSIEELKVVDTRIEEDVLTFLNLRNSMNARASYGGTATEETARQMAYYIEWIKGLS